MPYVAAAAVASAVIGYAASEDASRKQSHAAEDASQKEKEAAANANSTQIYMQQKALDYETGQTQPYTDAGKGALAQYMQLMGIQNPQSAGQPGSAASNTLKTASANTGATGNFVGSGNTNFMLGGASPAGGANQPPNASSSFDVSKMPGYDFQMKEALKATGNSAAASNGALSGNAQIALQDRAQGIASTQYNSYLDRLAGLVSLGENAGVNAGNQGVGIVQNAGNNISANQMALGNNLASNTIGAGNAQAAGTVAQGNQIGSALNSRALQNLFGSNSYSSNSSGIDTGSGSGSNYQMPDYSTI